MYRKNRMNRTTNVRNESVEGETLEMKIDRFVNNKEQLTERSAATIFMERKEGINAAYNIRTDRFEVAAEAMDKRTKSIQARREEKVKISDSAEPIHGTE